MRRIGYSTLLFLLLSLPALAQNGGINFQGMARNAAGEALANQKISLRLSVLLNSESGTVEYSETKEAMTSGQGIFSVVIGEGSILTKSGNFSDINWQNSPKFLKVELDPSGGSNFALLGTSKLQAVPFAYYANGVDAENIQGTLAVARGGTGVASISALKNSLGLDQVNNTADANKPLSSATQAALSTKVDKVTGKELSTNDYSTAEKTKLAAIIGTNTGDQDLSGYATNIALDLKANTNDVTNSLATKVDKVTGKGLSANDYSSAEKSKLAAITGINTGDQDLSGYATTAALATKATTSDVTTSLGLKANTTDVTSGLAGKVDKVDGKVLSSNDYSTAEKNKLAAITGTNTGDQDLSGYATTTSLAAKANTTDVTTGLAGKVDKVTGKELSTNDYSTAEKNKLADITGTNTGDQTNIPGNAGTATKLAASKTINGVAFDGSSDITMTAAAETLSGTALNGTVTGSSLTSVGNISSGSWNGDQIAVNKGGTGQTTYSDGQVLIGNSPGNTLTKATLTAGTGIVITNGAGSITIANSSVSVPSGTTSGDMLYWNGTAWVKVPTGTNGQVLTMFNGMPTWTGTISYANTITNPTTGRIWMDRNLGATRVASSATDSESFGDLYQWGRGADGHEKRTSRTKQVFAYQNQLDFQLNHGDFVLSDYNFWLNALGFYEDEITLWQGIAGKNNPCPKGFRIPSRTEWEAEIRTWGDNPTTGASAFNSLLKLPTAGIRWGFNTYNDNSITEGTIYAGIGAYWASDVEGQNFIISITFNASYPVYTQENEVVNGMGYSVRCIKD